MVPTKMKPFTNNDRVFLFGLFLNEPDADHGSEWFKDVATYLNTHREGCPIQLTCYHIAGLFRSIQKNKRIVLN